MNKRSSKKLVLSAETLGSLSGHDLQEVAGEAATGPRVCTTATQVCSGCAPCF